MACGCFICVSATFLFKIVVVRSFDEKKKIVVVRFKNSIENYLVHACKV